MALRVTQGLMYNSFVGNMNRNLSALMESNIQSSSQKRVNRPSDDPVATGRILSSRSTLNKIDMFETNVKEAMGWLNLADGVLASGDGSVQSILNRIKVLAEEGATGSLTAENRLQISYELRQQFEQIINIANSEFAGSHIFAGHKTDQPAYVEGLAVTASSGGGTIGEANFRVDGALTRTAIIQATGPGVPGAEVAAKDATYRYSLDGGKTWADVSPTVDPSTNKMTLAIPGALVTVDDPDKTVVAVDIDNEKDSDNGTWLYVRPTAVYQGDDHDNQVASTYTPAGATKIGAEATGDFPRDVAVRLDKIEGDKLYYSYSVDDGNNWTQVSTDKNATSLPVPGGYLELENAVSNDNQMGMQFIIHPHRADIRYQIGEVEYITANIVGKDVFGGLYADPKTGELVLGKSAEQNLFEVLGNLISAAECNDQDGMQAALPLLDNVMNVVLTKAAEVGGRENRLISTQGALVIRQYSEEDNLSANEDVDVTELMTRLAQQQIAYNSVLKSSSMIMQMSLVNFL